MNAVQRARPSAGTSPTIRRARGTDAEVLADLYVASFTATYAFPLAHDRDDIGAWMAGQITQHETWVAEEPGTPPRAIGFLTLGADDVSQLYVLPEHTGRGVGSRLLTLAMSRRPAGLELWTFQVNRRARDFYERRGFVAVELGDGSGNEEGHPDVRYVWRRQASDPL